MDKQAQDLMTMLERWIGEKEWYCENLPAWGDEKAMSRNDAVRKSLSVLKSLRATFQRVLEGGLSPELPGTERGRG
jgi:hypothetical protein